MATSDLSDPNSYSTNSTPSPAPAPKTVAADWGTSNPWTTTQSWYQKYLGRAANPDELDGYAYGPQGGSAVENAIANSEEARTYQRAQSQPKTDAAPAAPPPGPATGSPVTATGGIPSSNGVLQPAPAPVSTAPNQLRYVAPVDLNAAPAYQPMQFQTDPTKAYVAPTTAMPSYAGDKISQFAAPDQSGVNGQQSALVSAILGNPDTMNPQVVSQMKEAAKEQALLMQSQGQQVADQSGAASGRLGSGVASADQRQRMADTINAILTSNRATDVTAAQTNRQNELDALTGSEGIAQGQLGRATSSYGTGLSGQTAQAGVNQAQASSALQAAVSTEQQKQAAADSAQRNSQLQLAQQMAQAAENHGASTDAVQKILDQFGVNQGVAQNAQQNNAADVANTLGSNSQLLQYLQYLEGQRQFNGTLGFNYNNMDSNNQNTLLNWLQNNVPSS